jgi:AAA family ATP:ADP antiporter
MTDEKNGIVARAAKVLSDVESNELKATLASTLFIFILMASYYILRPVRDAMASDWTDSEVSFLWNINFFVSAAIVSAYGYAVSQVRLRNVVPVMYGFFAATFLAFYFSISTDRVLVDKLFYLWVSVFALFNVSVFWTFMADTFNPQQAKRLFGIIGAGASAGALFGPAIPALFAGILGTDTLMLIAQFDGGDSAGVLFVSPEVR